MGMKDLLAGCGITLISAIDVPALKEVGGGERHEAMGVTILV
jgi:hypothetical protein